MVKHTYMYAVLYCTMYYYVQSCIPVTGAY